MSSAVSPANAMCRPHTSTHALPPARLRVAAATTGKSGASSLRSW
jgi:hypothetical protein